MMLARLDLPRAYQAVANALEQEILSGRLPAGAPLPTETQLAELFGVTRHTVREGMRVLEQNGLVRREAGRRLHVALPRFDELAPQTSRALIMQRVSFRELYEMATLLEGKAMALAMERADTAMLAQRLRANVAETRTALAAGQSIVALDVAFHALIAEAAGNRVLLLSREPVSRLFHSSLPKLLDHPRMRDISPHRLIEAHMHIVDAIAAGDGVGACCWMGRHMDDFRRGYENAGFDLDDPIERGFGR